jgi:hypothetical protein
MNASTRDAFNASLAHLGGASIARCVMRAIGSTSCNVAIAMSTSAKIAVATASDDYIKSLRAASSKLFSSLLRHKFLLS